MDERFETKDNPVFYVYIFYFYLVHFHRGIAASCVFVFALELQDQP